MNRSGETRSEKEQENGVPLPFDHGNLCNSQSFLQKVIDSNPVVTMVIDRNYRVIMANQAARRLVGGKDPSALGLKCYQVSHNRDMPCHGGLEPCTLKKVLETKEPVVLSHTHYDDDGRKIIVEVRASPIFDEKGEVAQIVETCYDISGRRHLEKELAKERDFVAAVLDTAGALVVVLDTKGRIVRFNRACEKTTGYLFDEVEGRPFWDLFLAPEEVEPVKKVFQDLQGGQLSNEYENLWVGKNGTRRLIAWSNTTLLGEDGAVEYVIGTGIDITERKKTEEDLKILNETLEQKVIERTAVIEERARQLRSLASELTQVEQRERDRLAHVLHDHLQQLLVGARYSVGLLQAELQGADAQKRAEQIDELLGQSIDTSRSLTVELSPPILKEQELSRMISWLASWMKERHGLDIDLELETKTAAIAEDILTLLFQAVRELLFNVVKHAGIQHAHVRVTYPGEDRVQILVADSGIGFEPSSCSSKSGTNMGFGLFNVRERLKLIDGRLEVRSDSGKGTQVTLTAPYRKERQV